MGVLSIEVPIRKKSGNLFNDPHIYTFLHEDKKIHFLGIIINLFQVVTIFFKV